MSSHETKKYKMTWTEVNKRADKVAQQIIERGPYSESCFSIYGVPKSGIISAALVCEKLNAKLQTYECSAELLEQPSNTCVFIDDIIDSGKTQTHYAQKKAALPLHFFALVDKQRSASDKALPWISFPWERMNNENGVESNITRLLEYIGEDVSREGLLDTPNRVIQSWGKLYGGYEQKPEDVCTVFHKETYDEMVLVKDIEFYSTCEHHLLPFFGKAHIAYIPKDCIIGASKLARLLEIYTRRLQIQERICQQVVTAIDKLLSPVGSACILEAQHFCMTARGIEKKGATMTTAALHGAFKKRSPARQELYMMVNRKSD